MKFSEQHVFKGYWWLPENPGNKVAGVLTYTPEEKIVLELIGAFETVDGGIKDVLDMNHKEVSLIYGMDSNAKEISLVSCHSGFSLNLSCPFPMVRYSAQVLVYDKHITGLDELCHYTARIRFPELSYWAPPCAIEHRLNFSEDGKEIESSSYHIPKFDADSETMCSVVCENGVQLAIKREVALQSGELMLKPEMEQFSYLEIKKPGQGISIREILYEMHKVSQFLSLATKRNVRPERIWLMDPEVRQDFGDGRHYYFPIYILRVQIPVPNPAKIDRYEFLFRYEDVSANLPVLLEKWMSDTDNLWPIKNHLVDSLVYKPVVGSVDFLQVVQAIEGIWWRFRDDAYRVANNIPKKKRIYLNTILTEMKDSLSIIPSIAKMDLDIEAAVDSRHYYSHFLDKSGKPKTLEGWDLYELTRKLRMILLCLVLDLLGSTRDEIERILAPQGSS